MKVVIKKIIQEKVGEDGKLFHIVSKEKLVFISNNEFDPENERENKLLKLLNEISQYVTGDYKIELMNDEEIMKYQLENILKTGQPINNGEIKGFVKRSVNLHLPTNIALYSLDNDLDKIEKYIDDTYNKEQPKKR